MKQYQSCCHALITIACVTLIVGCSDSTSSSPGTTARQTIDSSKQTVQIVKTHGLVLPEGEGYDEFEVFLPPGETRWAYLIAGNDESFGPLTGHFVLQSRRRLLNDPDVVEWSVRAWRYRNHKTNVAGQLIGEAHAQVQLDERPPMRQVFCSLWDKPSKTMAIFDHSAPVQWSIYLHDTVDATSTELRTNTSSIKKGSINTDHNN